ncbi:amidohydrolase [Natronobacterium gregoryi]|uniref:5-methylthioadenosine/S-adenosylhomocysteine deaminase n=2 Tax=Natronobacterium gregoryi TaxID=44930 RepID=L0AIH4_NATGS|nr:amidohydrolase [Natronobacterium gregoryi]AFZ72977.1 cytosine deaminase-like metal-dependent hydrolase [Natronobacterium gregoryi SP2]ELY69875.1 amidohydrolase [Natronobacterium gregoryi SP2]PLK21939.1 S-adenosylhomocysteine deaminase [Natronobacterium gregoryi SP2]SFI68920.1 5-methylthioadenosine/S-adenosylhomocysteine deaminase [Natronobacterium gregoryi]
MVTLAITDGQVLTPEFTVERADVLIDQDRGEILEIGPDLAGDADETLDAAESLVTPGFVNGHCHVAMTLLRGHADDKPLDAWLQEDIWPVEAELTAETVRAGTELGVLEMIKSGTTAFADMYFFVPTIADVVAEAGLRARLGHGVISVAKDDEAAREDAREGLSVAEEIDGMGDGRISSAFMPHSLTTVDGEYLEEFVPQAREIGVPIHYHANETEDEVTPIVEEHGVRPLAYAAEKGMLESEDFVAHGVHVEESEIGLLAEAGTGVIHCPASNMKLASGMAPVERMREAGITVGIGTDGAASNNDLSMLDEARDAAMIGKLAADDASAVPAGAVVEMMTDGSAEAVGFESGRLKAGAPADLAVIDLEKPHLTPRNDLVSHLAYAAAAADVRHTVCDGQVLMRDREVRTLDELAVRERATEETEKLLARAGQ